MDSSTCRSVFASTATDDAPPALVLELAKRICNGHVVKSAKQTPLESRQEISTGTARFESVTTDDISVTLLARGGYNDVWLVKATFRAQSAHFVLRLPNEDSLEPHQIRNEVGWLRYIANEAPEIPRPEVYEFLDQPRGDRPPFILEEYVDAPRLSDVWMSFSETDKDDIARQIAELIVRLGELRFDCIGGMTPGGTLGPTVEGAKLFKGRSKFHDPACYDLGPYRSIQEYILAQYDKEIYYYTHASDDIVDQDLFCKVSQSDYVEELKRERIAAESELDRSPRMEPFVLCHNDLHSRNVLMNGTKVAAIIDWEFAGAYPLSELNADTFEVMEWESEEAGDEILRWGRRIRSELVPGIATERRWDPKDIVLLTSAGDQLLQSARVEMCPSGIGESDLDEDAGIAADNEG